MVRNSWSKTDRGKALLAKRTARAEALGTEQAGWLWKKGLLDLSEGREAWWG